MSGREEAPQWSNLRSARTCLAPELVGAEVLAVVEEVAAQRGADAPVVGALELVLLTRGDGGGGRWGVREAKAPGEPLPSWTRNKRKKAKLTAVDFIRAVSAVVDAVASPGQRQAHAVVLAAEGPGRGALEPP